ncbi:uncharacterized protein [Triticum aestivum]|uniref:uncharacterized protein n=1 Tax=Triticum aestivum TaxID=4565 RepID=UPI001D034B09|nr:uncharacterized protein LOC123160669 [Triticum aestivum]
MPGGAPSLDLPWRRASAKEGHTGKRLILGGKPVPDLVPNACISRVTKSPTGVLCWPVGGRARLGHQVAVGEHKVPRLRTWRGRYSMDVKGIEASAMSRKRRAC